MRKEFFVATIILPLLLTSCATRKCGPNDYGGLYNALTCDYDARITELETLLSTEKEKELKLFNAYQKLIAKVTKQENIVQAYRDNIVNIENDVLEIERELQGVKTQKYTKQDIAKLKSRLIKIRKNIIVKQVRFKSKDIKLAKNYLKSRSSDIKLAKTFLNPKEEENIKLARKFLDRNGGNTVKLVKSYNREYESSEDVKLSLATSLDKIIAKVSASEESGTIDKKTTKMLIATLDDTKRYTSSVKD